MANFSIPFRFGDRLSRAMAQSDDDSNDGDTFTTKALLEGEDDHEITEDPPPYRSKPRHGVRSRGFAIGIVACTVLLGLLTLCSVWLMVTLRANGKLTEELDMHRPGKVTTLPPIPVDESSEGPDTDFDDEIFTGWKDCGSNVEEAKAKGCMFDVMLHSWVHEDCFDKELMDDYLLKVPYHWYRDWRHKEEITVDEMRLGEHGSAAVKLEEHGTHCAYVLEKNLKAIMNHKPMARSIYSVKHAVHCIGLLVDPSTIPGIYTEVVVEYDQCGIPNFEQN